MMAAGPVRLYEALRGVATPAVAIRVRGICLPGWVLTNESTRVRPSGVAVVHHGYLSTVDPYVGSHGYLWHAGRGTRLRWAAVYWFSTQAKAQRFATDGGVGGRYKPERVTDVVAREAARHRAYLARRHAEKAGA